jgi:hypothetical protein
MAVELDGTLKHTVFLVGLVAKSSRDLSKVFKGLGKRLQGRVSAPLRLDRVSLSLSL